MHIVKEPHRSSTTRPTLVAVRPGRATHLVVASLAKDGPELRAKVDAKLGLAKRLTVLSIGDDANLLRLRQLIMETDGYLVHSVSSVSPFGSCWVGAVDIILLCHTVSAERIAAIRLWLLGLNPRLPVLSLVCPDQDPPDACDLLDPLEGPAVLLRKLKQISERSAGDAR